jgi:hypothetical protein
MVMRPDSGFIRGIDLILEEGMNVKLYFPDGEDPDSFVKKHLMMI